MLLRNSGISFLCYLLQRVVPITILTINSLNSKQHRCFQAKSSRSQSRHILKLSLRRQVYYRVRNSSQIAPVSSQINPLSSLLSYFIKTRFNLRTPTILRFLDGLVVPCCSTKILYICSLFPMRATCPSISPIFTRTLQTVAIKQTVKLLIKFFSALTTSYLFLHSVNTFFSATSNLSFD